MNGYRRQGTLTAVRNATMSRRAYHQLLAVVAGVAVLTDLLAGRGLRAQEPLYLTSDVPCCATPDALCSPGGGCGPGLGGRLRALLQRQPCALASFYVDYRIRRFGEAHTSYQFADPDPGGPYPLSELHFPLNSTWNGLEAGLESSCWAVRAEWVTPFGEDIDGQAEDKDWLWEFADLPPQEEPSNLGVMKQRFVDAHMVDLSLELKLFEGRIGVPVSIWPVGGFRWQKFDITAYDHRELKGFDSVLYQFMWLVPPVFTEGDAIRFWQEYLHYYAGGQLRFDLPDCGFVPPMRLTVQGDWAHVEATNFDHHLLREGVFITKQDTDGNAWHVGVTGEIFFTDRFSVGVEADYTQIRTTGSHHFTNAPLAIDQTWTRGVRVWSEQSGVTFFMRLRF